MDMKFCKRVSKFKMAYSKGPLGACQNQPKFYPEMFSAMLEGLL